MKEFCLIIAVCILACFCCILLKKYLKEQALILSCTVCTVILLKLLSEITPFIGNINDFFSILNIDKYYSDILLKSLGICYLSKLGENICKDCGENTIGMVIQLASKISLSLITLPIFKDVINILIEVLE
jgi:stage III sporulation protein AD